MISAVAGIRPGVPEVFQRELFTRNRSRQYTGMALIPVSHAGGTVHNPDTILNAIVEAAR